MYGSLPTVSPSGSFSCCKGKAFITISVLRRHDGCRTERRNRFAIRFQLIEFEGLGKENDDDDDGGGGDDDDDDDDDDDGGGCDDDDDDDDVVAFVVVVVVVHK